LAGVLADIASDLSRGTCVLVVCDKGWTLPIFRAIFERLKGKDIRCEYLDGRPAPDTEAPADVGIMLTTIGQLRRAVRGEVEGVVFALPHLDVMTTSDGGWTNISREVIPLLYENELVQWLGFRDPSLPLLPLVEKLFNRRYVIEEPYRTSETIQSSAVAAVPVTTSGPEPESVAPSETPAEQTDKQEPPV
jgi:cell division protease FtsH